MAHHDAPIGDSVFAIVAAFTSGLDVFKRLRERRRRRRSSKKPPRATPAPLEPSGDELCLSNSLRQGPVDIQRQYDDNYKAAGEPFARGDAIAHASLTEVLLKLNSGLVAIIGAFLTPGKDERHPDYKSLTSLSDTSRAEAIDALGQLYQRLSQSQLALDRVRHKCQSCGSPQHQDCLTLVPNQPRQRGGCTNARKPKSKRSQMELVIVRRPRNTTKPSSSRSSSSTALSTKKSTRQINPSLGPSAPNHVAPPLPLPDVTRPPLPRSHSTSSKQSAPPSYAQATQTPSRDKSLTRKPVKPAAPSPPPQHQKPTTVALPLQRPETWPHGPRPLREPTLPFIHPQPYQPSIQHHPQQQQHQPALYQPPRPPKLPAIMSAAELPGSTPSVLHRRTPPLPPPKPQHLNTTTTRPPTLPKPQHLLNAASHHPSSPINPPSLDMHVHPAFRHNNKAGGGGAGFSEKAGMSASTYSFSSDSTKLGEIPTRKWTVPWDYGEMERLNAEVAAAATAAAAAAQTAQGEGQGEGKKKGLLGRFLRRGSG